MAVAKEMHYKITDKFTPEVIAEIEDMAGKEGVTAENFLKRGEKPINPLHSLIPAYAWDDKQAAHIHRLDIARRIINEIKIVIDEVEYPAFENVRVTISEGETARLYLSRPEILAADDLRKQKIRTFHKLMKTYEKQYRSFVELEPIFVAVDETMERLETEWDKEPH